MRFNLKPLPALISLMLLGCGGGGTPDANGDSTTAVNASGNATATGLTACVDVNQNWQCDDGDVSKTAAAAGTVGFTVAASQYVLLESRNAENQRTRLLVSEKGSDNVNGLSTLRTVLKASGQTTAQIAGVEAALLARHGTSMESLLATGYSTTLQTHPMALAALDAYSRAVAAQTSASPTVSAYSASVGTANTDAAWASTEGSDTRRQLSAQSSVVLNNSESNRLYLFDAANAAVSSREIDLIPPAAPVLAGYPKLLRYSVALLEKAVNVMVDTASAATGFANPPSAGSPVVLPPGKGIASIQLTDGGNSALVVMNMLSGVYKGDACLGTGDGNEGLFKVSLTDTTSSRFLKNSPACIHSGFSLIAADAKGTRVAAWDAVGARLWLIDAGTMQKQAAIDLKFDADKPPQALAVTPGGRYLAAAGYGRLALIDLQTGKVAAQLTGDWGNVTQAAFAGGARRVLLASGSQVHSVLLTDAFQLISRSAVSVGAAGQELRGLAVAADGDSYVATSDTTAHWRSASTGAAFGTSNLPSGLTVQQATLAGKRLVVLARGAQDKQFKLLRLPVGLPSSPADMTAIQ